MPTSTTKGPGSVADTGTAPIARSPISQTGPVRTHEGWEVSAARSDAALRLADLTPLGKELVRAAASSAAARRLDCPFGATRREPDGSLVLGTGPDEWLILSPAGRRSEVAGELESSFERDRAGELVTVIDLTHGSVVLRLSGERAHRALEKVCAIDFSDRTTPNGSCFRSSVARLRCTVARDDLGTERSYLIESDRSSGQYLFDALREASIEFAIEVDGYLDKEI